MDLQYASQKLGMLIWF